MKDWAQIATCQIIQEFRNKQELRQEIDRMDDSIKVEIFERIEDIVREAATDYLEGKNLQKFFQKAT